MSIRMSSSVENADVPDDLRHSRRTRNHGSSGQFATVRYSKWSAERSVRKKDLLATTSAGCGRIPPGTGTQILPPSGTMRQRSCPVSSGTQGTPLQQSPLYAHVSPPARHVGMAWHLGTPSASSTHASELPGAPQQLFGAEDTLHE